MAVAEATVVELFAAVSTLTDVWMAFCGTEIVPFTVENVVV